MPLFARRLGAWIDPADVFVTLYSSDENAFWLDREAHPSQRFSVLGHTKSTEVITASELLAEYSEPLTSSAHRSVGLGGADGSPELPFDWRPGFVGWFDYLQDPRLPESVTGVWLRAAEAIVLDHAGRAIWLVGEFDSQLHFTEWVNAALIRLGLSGGQRIGYLQRHADAGPAKLVRMAHSPDQYSALIERAKEHIAQGDVYQLCLTNKLDLSHSADPLAVFLRLRAQNPAPYACYIRVGSRAMVSVSPEQFLSVDSDGRAVTRPIKGTRPRAGEPSVDAQIAGELANHPKERAENLMIVDLMRNDLARVSMPDSVVVDELFSVEAHPTVHQLVSTVSSQLKPEVTFAEVLGSVFPGGSMTGAPKFRAMELISELEAVPRGTYSGVAGYISDDGRLDLGMNIRTLIFDGNTVTLGVGGGITIDSEPQAEVAETALKAEALLAVLGVESPWAGPTDLVTL